MNNASRRSHGWALILLCAAVLAGCGRVKQQAALEIETASINLADARNAGAQKYAASLHREADRALKEARALFEKKEFPKALARAEASSQAAVKAGQLAKEIQKPKPPSQQKTGKKK